MIKSTILCGRKIYLITSHKEITKLIRLNFQVLFLSKTLKHSY